MSIGTTSRAGVATTAARRGRASRGTAGTRPPGRSPRRNARPYLLIAPAAIALAVTLGYPVVQMILLAFQRENLRDLIHRQTTWVGLANFQSVLGDSFFWTVTIRTFLFSAFCVAMTLLIGTGVAQLLFRAGAAAKAALSAVMVVVWAIPVIVSGAVWSFMFGTEFGVVNSLLTKSGLCACDQHSWLGQQWTAMGVLAAVVIWGAVPFVAFSLYGGLLTVPGELTDAARVDGAGRWTVFRTVTFPILKPVYAILTILSTVWDTRVLPQTVFTTQGGPYQSTTMFGYYIYAKGVHNSQFGMASAIACLMTLMLSGLAWLFVRTLRSEI